MRFLRSLPYCFAFVAGTTLVHGQSPVSDDEPQLGPIVLIATGSQDPNEPGLLPDEAELGPIVPISAKYEVSDESLPVNIRLVNDEFYPQPPDESEGFPRLSLGEIRVIGGLVPAPVLEPLPLPIPPAASPIHPDEIQSHLSAAAAQLAAAGLLTESQAIVEFQHQFQRQHSQRLLLAFKEAQLKALQAEIDFLKQSQRPVLWPSDGNKVTREVPIRFE